MSLATQVSSLLNAGADARKDAFGSTVVITDFSNGQHTYTAATFYGSSGGINVVSGGFYDIQSIGVEIKTADLAADSNFVPEPEMAVTALGNDMRIAADGVTPGLYVYRLHLVNRKSPARAV